MSPFCLCLNKSRYTLLFAFTHNSLRHLRKVRLLNRGRIIRSIMSKLSAFQTDETHRPIMFAHCQYRWPSHLLHSSSGQSTACACFCALNSISDTNRSSRSRRWSRFGFCSGRVQFATKCRQSIKPVAFAALCHHYCFFSNWPALYTLRAYVDFAHYRFMECTAIFEIPPVNWPSTAVKASIAVEAKK